MSCFPFVCKRGKLETTSTSMSRGKVKVVSGVRGRLHFHELEGMGRNEKKMSEIYQVRRAGTGYVRLGSSCVCAPRTLATGERKVLVTHPRGRGARHVRKGLVGGREGRILI